MGAPLRNDIVLLQGLILDGDLNAAGQAAARVAEALSDRGFLCLPLERFAKDPSMSDAAAVLPVLRSFLEKTADDTPTPLPHTRG